jgi:hypothetical protein
MGQEEVIMFGRKSPLSVTFIPTNGTGGGYHVWAGSLFFVLVIFPTNRKGEGYQFGQAKSSLRDH